jgi:hypothetical protein
VPTDQTAYQNGGIVRLQRNIMGLNTVVDGGAFITARQIELSGNAITGTGQMELNADVIDVTDNRIDGGTVKICNDKAAPSSCNILRNIVFGTISATPNANSANGMCAWRVLDNVVNNTVSVSCYHNGSTYYDTAYVYGNTSDSDITSYLSINYASVIMDTYDYSAIGYRVGTTTDNGLYAGAITIDGTKPIHVIALTGDVTSVTLASGKTPSVGHICHVIFTGTGSVSLVHNATSCVCPEGTNPEPLTIPSGGFVEVDFINANGKIYARCV